MSTNYRQEGGDDLKALKAIRALRGLRPLRAIQRFENLKVIVNALFVAVPACSNVALVLGLFYLVSGILGRNFYMGKFYSCNDESRTCYPWSGVTDCPVENQCIGLFNSTITGMVEERLWANPTFGPNSFAYNFDTVGNSMLILFEASTLELYLDVMYAAGKTTVCTLCLFIIIISRLFSSFMQSQLT